VRLTDILHRFRTGIIIALGLVVIEYVAWIIEPGVFGPVIDALVAAAGKDPHPSPAGPLLIWIGVFAINSGIGAIRRSVDERIYLNMFTEIATQVSRSSLEQRLSVSQTAARAELSSQYITFFQYRVPEIAEQVILIGGALVGLAFFDLRIAAACGAVVIPLFFISLVYGTRVVALQTSIHDDVERAYDIFQTKDPERVRAYYTALARPRQRIANWGAVTFGLMRLFLLGIFLVVLYVAIDLDDFSTGNIYSIVAYIWTFLTSVEYLPELLESWTSLRDISRRLHAADVEPATVG